MIRAAAISAAAAAALLSGCAAVPAGPQAAAVTVPPAFVYAPPPGARVPIAALLPRADPAFHILVAGLTGPDGAAPDLAAALARIDAARAALRAAGAARAPDVSLSRSAGVNRINRNFATDIAASWDADVFGRLRASQRAARLRLDAADRDAAAVRLALVSDIARAVIDTRTAQAKLKIVEDDLADAAALVALTGARTRAGIAPGLDLVRAEGLAAAARSQRPPAETELAAALGRLVTLTGRDGPAVQAAFAVPRGTPGGAGLADPLPLGLATDLLRQRPDMMAAEARLGAANAEIAAAAASRFPQFNISAALGFAALALGDLFAADSLTASLGASVAGPLVDFGRVGAQIDARQADASVAFADYRGTLFAALGEAETALGSNAAARASVSALIRQQQVEAASVGLATARYRMGIGDFLGVVDAQRQLNATRLGVVEAQGAAERAQIELYRAFGGDADTGRGGPG